MDEFPNVVIVMARCGQTKQCFGIRFEEKATGQWIATWAFAVKETLAKREGYDKGEIAGSIGFDTAYPGCPYCRNISIFKCGCGKVACWDGEQLIVSCPWCETRCDISGEIRSLSAEGDL